MPRARSRLRYLSGRGLGRCRAGEAGGAVCRARPGPAGRCRSAGLLGGVVAVVVVGVARWAGWRWAGRPWRRGPGGAEGRGRVGRAGAARCGPPSGARVGRVDRRGGQVRRPGGARLGGQPLVHRCHTPAPRHPRNRRHHIAPQPRATRAAARAPPSHPSPTPPAQSPPPRRARGAEQGGGQPVPPDAGAHRVQDARQGGPVVGTPAARVAEAPRTHWDQRLRTSPRLIGRDLLAHVAISERIAAPEKPARRFTANRPVSRTRR